MKTSFSVLLLGDSQTSSALLESLKALNLTVIIPGVNESVQGFSADAILKFLGDNSSMIMALESIWFAWLQTDDSALMLSAYRAGARAVFPLQTPPEIIARTIYRTLSESTPENFNPQHQIQRRYLRGDVIFLDADTVIQINEGILATAMIHLDGTEVLLGLSRAGQIIVAHPADDCHVQILAHTDVSVTIQDWNTATRQPDFNKKLRSRLQQMEGWAAMQARPHIDQRILGILGLLAGQFGRPNEQGILIDVRLTHTQLASAVGAARTTVTRVLGELRNLDILTIVSIDGEDRFCLRKTSFKDAVHAC
jgi:CRP-like cAMP-binding protein